MKEHRKITTALQLQLFLSSLFYRIILNMNRRMQDQKKSQVGNKGQLQYILYSKQFLFIVLKNSPASFGERKDYEHWGFFS